MSTAMMLALAIFVLLAVLGGAFIITLIVGPTAYARRKRAREGPTPETDGEPAREV